MVQATVTRLHSPRKIDALAATMISLPRGGDVRLDDLGLVTDTIAERKTFTRFNGKPVVAISVKRARRK